LHPEYLASQRASKPGPRTSRRLQEAQVAREAALAETRAREVKADNTGSYETEYASKIVDNPAELYAAARQNPHAFRHLFDKPSPIDAPALEAHPEVSENYQTAVPLTYHSNLAAANAGRVSNFPLTTVVDSRAPFLRSSRFTNDTRDSRLGHMEYDALDESSLEYLMARTSGQKL